MNIFISGLSFFYKIGRILLDIYATIRLNRLLRVIQSSQIQAIVSISKNLGASAFFLPSPPISMQYRCERCTKRTFPVQAGPRWYPGRRILAERWLSGDRCWWMKDGLEFPLIIFYAVFLGACLFGRVPTIHQSWHCCCNSDKFGHGS